MIAEKWGCPPWIVTGEKLTPWRRMVWRFRVELYLSEINAKLNRQQTQVNQRFSE